MKIKFVQIIKFIKYFSFALAMVGAMNWCVIGAFDFNIVEYIWGGGAFMTKFLYVLIGLSAMLTSFYAVVECACESHDYNPEAEQELRLEATGGGKH